eukprot:184475_1
MSAYDEDVEADEKQALAGHNPVEDVGVGVIAMGGRVEAQYENDVQQQKDQHEAPETPTFCVKLLLWFPLRAFAFFGGIVLVTCTILDFAFNQDDFIQFLIRIYLMLCGVVIILIESPVWRLTRHFQLRIYFWFRILSRMWGRAYFYLFLVIMCFGEFEQTNAAEFTIAAGFYLLVIMILSFIYSKMGGNKLNRMYVFIISGSEGDQIDVKLSKKYDELIEATGIREEKLGSSEINKLANDAGRVLSNAERHAIQTYLDVSCNGFVNKKDWMTQFLRLKTGKQRYL